MKEKFYKGSSKTLYNLEDPSVMIMSFDDTIKIPNKDPITVEGKGVINNDISSYLMQKLKMIGVNNHFIEKKNMRQQLVYVANVYPIEVHVSSIASGRYLSDFAIEPGFVFNSPIIDFILKDKNQKSPAVNEYQIEKFGWIHKEDISEIKVQALKIYDFLSGLFIGAGIRLVDLKLEFGHIFNDGDFINMLVDEISPDNCILWDMETNENLSYELAHKNPEKILPSYQEIIKRLNIKNY